MPNQAPPPLTDDPPSWETSLTMGPGLRAIGIASALLLVAACGSSSKGGDPAAGASGGGAANAASGAGGIGGVTPSGGSLSVLGGTNTGGTLSAGAAGQSGESGTAGHGEQGGSAGAGGASVDSAGAAGQAGAALCHDETVTGSIVPNDCSIDHVSIDQDALCPGSANCPVSDAYTMHCDGWGYGPWLASTPNGDAFVGYVTAINVFRTRVFTLHGAGKVEELPAFPDVSTMTTDRQGALSVFGGIAAQLTRARFTDDGILLSTMTNAPKVDFVQAIEARAIDENDAFVAYLVPADFASEYPYMAVQKDGCWTTRQLAPRTVGALAMDVDPQGKPWAAWYDDLGNVGITGPDGTIYSAWDQHPPAINPWRPPHVLGGGFQGTSQYPVAATQEADGLHILSREGNASSWTNRVLPSSALSVENSSCPGSSVQDPDACGGLSTCSVHPRGAVNGFALARTASGRAFAAWVDESADISYDLTPDDPSTCGASCYCTARVRQSAGTADLVIAPISDAATPASALRRFHFQTGGRVALDAMAVSMAAQGETLHVLASISTDTSTRADLRYLKIDATGLP